MGGNIPCVGGLFLVGGMLGCLDLTWAVALVPNEERYRVPGAGGWVLGVFWATTDRSMPPFFVVCRQLNPELQNSSVSTSLFALSSAKERTSSFALNQFS